MDLFAQNRVRKYSGAVAARPRAGFGRVISRGGPNLVLTRVVTALNQGLKLGVVRKFNVVRTLNLTLDHA